MESQTRINQEFLKAIPFNRSDILLQNAFSCNFAAAELSGGACAFGNKVTNPFCIIFNGTNSAVPHSKSNISEISADENFMLKTKRILFFYCRNLTPYIRTNLQHNGKRPRAAARCYFSNAKSKLIAQV